MSFHLGTDLRPVGAFPENWARIGALLVGFSTVRWAIVGTYILEQINIGLTECRAEDRWHESAHFALLEIIHAIRTVVRVPHGRKALSCPSLRFLEMLLFTVHVAR